MHERRVVNSLPSVGEIGLGCVGMSAEYGAGTDWNQPSHRSLIQWAMDNGVTLIDTADSYGPYTNEVLVGEAIAGRREQVVVSTKCGLVPDERKGAMVPDGRPEHIRQACDDSLRRLQIDSIDLYFLHRVDPRVPLEDSWGALSELVTAGKVRALGLSEVTVDQLDRAHSIFEVSCVQSELSLWSRGALGGVLPWCERHAAGFIAYAPLGRGFLTGSITSAEFSTDDIRASNPRFSPDAIAANQALVREIRRVSVEVSATPAQVAIAWILAQGSQVVPIPGTKKQTHLADNLGASEVVLDSAAVASLDALPEPVGARY